MGPHHLVGKRVTKLLLPVRGVDPSCVIRCISTSAPLLRIGDCGRQRDQRPPTLQLWLPGDGVAINLIASANHTVVRLLVMVR
jgi:hypothetical protein